MPTYEYKCLNCGRKFEIFQGMLDEHKKRCIICDKDNLKRLIGTGAGIIFKGSGFYETDYRSDSYKKDVEKDRKSAPEKKKETVKKKKSKQSLKIK